MSFAEDFPSLNECGQFGDEVVSNEDIDEETLWIRREEVKEHCLDKKKVGDLLDTFAHRCLWSDESVEQLKKELNIE